MPFFVAYHPEFIYDVPENHRFPMEKYAMLFQQLAYEELIDERNILTPDLSKLEDVSRVHTADYIAKLTNLTCTEREQRVSGFVHTKALIEREFRIVEATRMCAEAVRNGGIALNIAGGTHHAFSNRGEGFCLLNDQAVAAKWLLDKKIANRILIVDLDVHQGNGTAEIFRSNSQVFTLSMHGKSNYPLEKEVSDLDLEMENDTTDDVYLQVLRQNFATVINDFRPDFLFYQCGVDVLKTDKLGKLKLTQDGIRNRDLVVLSFAAENGIPLVCSICGGYSEEIREIVNAHMHVFREGYKLFSDY